MRFSEPLSRKMPSIPVAVAAYSLSGPHLNKEQELVHTFFFQEDTTLGDHDGYVSVDIALPVLVYERYGNIGICDALAQWHTKDAMWPSFGDLGSKSRVSRARQNEDGV